MQHFDTSPLSFLKQQLAHTWFLIIASVCECLYPCVCVCPEAINNMMWCDIDPIYDWSSKQVLWFYIVGIMFCLNDDVDFYYIQRSLLYILYC